MTLKSFQEKQSHYDKDYFAINAPSFEKLRHITLHIADSLGKLANYCESIEHKIHANELNICHKEGEKKIVEEIIPDLLIHSLQLANMFNLNLDEQYLKRLEDNIKRITSSKNV